LIQIWIFCGGSRNGNITLMTRSWTTSEFPDLSQPVLKIRNRGVINVPMRDGVPLATEVLEPEGEVRWRRRSKMECSI
jgi:hypothetical protein